MKQFLLILLFLVALLTACSNETEEINFLDLVEVELILPTAIAANEEISAQIKVTQNEKTVDQVNEAVFEIWQHGKSDTYVKEEAEAKGNGIYEVTWIAPEDGVYYIYYHVTANGMHRMEKNQLVIGDVDVEKILTIPDEHPNKFMK